MTGAALPAIVFEIHHGLPREGPGDAASTRRALAAIGPLSGEPWMLDVGCGPGAQTVEFEALPSARIVALDLHHQYLNQLSERLPSALKPRVYLMRASMMAMPFAAASFDVIWAEGSIYIGGFDESLAQWRSLLKPRGHLAATHLSWLTADPPAEPREFWRENFPAMRHKDDNARIARESGYDVVDQFVLPESAWWTGYYGPLEARLPALRARYAGDADAIAALDATAYEIDLYRRHSRAYGYVFYVLRRGA